MDHAYNSKTGFAQIDGVHIWIYGPSDAQPDWNWSATKYNGDYPGGCPKFVEGIGTIQGQADTEEQALQMAQDAAKLIGCQPGDVVHLSINSPVRTELVAVADGPAERVKG